MTHAEFDGELVGVPVPAISRLVDPDKRHAMSAGAGLGVASVAHRQRTIRQSAYLDIGSGGATRPELGAPVAVTRPECSGQCLGSGLRLLPPVDSIGCAPLVHKKS